MNAPSCFSNCTLANGALRVEATGWYDVQIGIALDPETGWFDEELKGAFKLFRNCNEIPNTKCTIRACEDLGTFGATVHLNAGDTLSVVNFSPYYFVNKETGAKEEGGCRKVNLNVGCSEHISTTGFIKMHLVCDCPTGEGGEFIMNIGAPGSCGACASADTGAFSGAAQASSGGRVVSSTFFLTRRTGFFTMSAMYKVTLSLVLLVVAGCSTAKSNRHFTQGTIKLLDGKYEMAITHLEKAVAYAPHISRNQNNLACAYWEVGEVERAWVHSRKAIRADLDNRYASELFLIIDDQMSSKYGMKEGKPFSGRAYRRFW